jgi:hypothetical protein
LNFRKKLGFCFDSFGVILKKSYKSNGKQKKKKAGPAQLAATPEAVRRCRTPTLTGGVHLPVRLPPLDESDPSTKPPPLSDFATASQA